MYPLLFYFIGNSSVVLGKKRFEKYQAVCTNECSLPAAFTLMYLYTA